MNPCTHCSRPMRRTFDRPADHPDTVTYGARGLCTTCRDHEHLHGTLDDGWMPGPPRGPGGNNGPVPLPLFDARPWSDQALCNQTDPEMFFPEKGGSTREAKAVCMRCEVRAECLEDALIRQERFGIWGGLSERERRKLAKAS